MKNESLVIMVLILIYSISFSNNKFLSLSKPIDLDIVVPNNNFPMESSTNGINKIINKENKDSNDTGANAKNVSIINSNSNNKQINITKNSNSHNIIYNSQASINEYKDFTNKPKTGFPYKPDTKRERQEDNSNSNVNNNINRNCNDDETSFNSNNLSQIDSTIESKGITKNRLSHKHQKNNNNKIFRTSSNVNNYIPNMSDIHILHKKTLPDDLDNSELIDNKSSEEESNIENNNNIDDNNDEETRAIDPNAYGVLKNKYTTEYEDNNKKDNNVNKTNIVNNDSYYDFLKNNTHVANKENDSNSTINDNLSNVLKDIKDNLDLMSSPFIPSTGFPFVPSIDNNIVKGIEKGSSDSKLDNKNSNDRSDNNKKITVVNKYYFDNKNTILKTPNNANVYNYYNSTNYENNDFDSDNNQTKEKTSNKDDIKAINKVSPDIPMTNKKVDKLDKASELDISNIAKLNDENINVNSNIISNIPNPDGFVSPTIVNNDPSTSVPTFNNLSNNTSQENNKVSVVDHNSDIRDMNDRIDKEMNDIKVTSHNSSTILSDNTPIYLNTDDSNTKSDNSESKNKNQDEDTFYLPYLLTNKSQPQNTQENQIQSNNYKANFRSNKQNEHINNDKRELLNKSVLKNNHRFSKASRLKPIKKIKEKHIEAITSPDKSKDDDLLLFLETNENILLTPKNIERKEIKETKEINRLIKESKANKKNKNNHDSKENSLNSSHILKNKDVKHSRTKRSEDNSKYDYEFTSNLNNKDKTNDDMILEEFVKLRVKRIKL